MLTTEKGPRAIVLAWVALLSYFLGGLCQAGPQEPTVPWFVGFFALSALIMALGIALIVAWLKGHDQ